MAKHLSLILAFFFLATGAVLAQQPNRSDLEKERADIQRQIEDVRKSLDETKKNRKETLGQLALLQRRLKLRERAIRNVNQQINVIDAEVNQSWREILSLRRELDTLKMQYEKSVVYAYKNRSNYDFLNFLFSATSFNDALRRVEYLKSYRNYREEQADNIQRNQQQLQQKIANLNENKIKKSEVLQEQSKQMRVLEDDKKEKEAVVSKL